LERVVHLLRSLRRSWPAVCCLRRLGVWAEIPHVRGAERAAFRLSLAGGEPFPVYGLVHRSPHPLAISLFTVRVERVRYVHVQVSLRRSVLSALSIRYRDTTIDVWTYGNRYTLRTGYARASSSSVRSTDTTE
jgi:hypothetical protein